MSRYSSFGPLDSQIEEQSDVGFVRFNDRLRPDQLQPGELAMSVNGRMSVSGAWQTRKGVDSFGPIIGVSSSALTAPFTCYTNRTITAATRSNTVVTITTSVPHGFVAGTLIYISGLTGTVSPTGNRTIATITSTTFTFIITGATGSETYSLSTPFAGAPIISSDINAAYGSCLYSDPKSSNSEYIVIALNKNAIAVNRITGASTDISYPSGITVTSSAEMIQAFDKVYIFINGVTTLYWNGVLTSSPAFVKVANGTYTANTYLSAGSNTSISNGIVTVSATAHGLSVGTQIYVVDIASSGPALTLNGDGYTIATVATNSFTFYAQIADHASHSCVYSVRQSQGRGLSRMPAPAWGVYHQRRLIVPFSYTTTGTSGSETITARNVSDEMLFSDIFDSDTYDQLQNDFKVTAGIADYLQYVHPFTEDQALAFNRHSIHLINGVSGSLADIQIREITREAGLVARKSVVTIANQIYFLSDAGVYSTNFGEFYTLRGAGLPLSAPIDPIIQRINKSYAYKAVAAYYDNRYYLAVPLDGSIINNAILVYNILNQGWESLDLIDQGGWNISNFIVAGSAGDAKLYAVNSFGGINVIEARVDDVDSIYTYPGVNSNAFPIASYCESRQYIFDSPARKKFNTFELHAESSDTNSSDARIDIIAENLDNDFTLGTLRDYLGDVLPIAEDCSVRGRIGNLRAYGAQIRFTPIQGRPKMRLIKLTASQTFRATTQAS